MVTVAMYVLQGHHEVPPYSESSKRTVYHLRELEIYRMAHLLSVHRGEIFFLKKAVETNLSI